MCEEFNSGVSQQSQKSWISCLTPLKFFLLFFLEDYHQSKCAHTNTHFFCPLHKSTNGNYCTTGVSVCSLCVSCPWGNILNGHVFPSQTAESPICQMCVFSTPKELGWDWSNRELTATVNQVLQVCLQRKHFQKKAFLTPHH